MNHRTLFQVFCITMFWIGALSLPQTFAQAAPDQEPEIEVVEDLEIIEPASTSTIKLWPLHAMAMILGALQLWIGMAIALRRRRNNCWLSIHKTLGLSSLALILFGFGIGYFMKLHQAQPHFNNIHAQIGLAGVLLVCALPLLGFGILAFPRVAKKLRPIHVWLGRLLLILLLLLSFSGLQASGWLF